MPWAEYGLAGIVLGFLLILFGKILKSFLIGIKSNTENLMGIITAQRTTEQNHIQHLDESVKSHTTALAEHSKDINNGVNRICDAIENQTKIMESSNKNK